MTRWGTPERGGAFISVSCTPAQKRSWDALVDQLGFKSMSAMVRYAIETLILEEIGVVPVDVHRRDVASKSTEGDR